MAMAPTRAPCGRMRNGDPARESGSLVTPEVTVRAAGGGRRSSFGAGGSARAAVEPPVSERVARHGAAREGSGLALCGDAGDCGARGRGAVTAAAGGRGGPGRQRRSCRRGRRCRALRARCHWDPLPRPRGRGPARGLARGSRRAAPPRSDCGPYGSAGRALMLSPAATLGGVGRGRLQPPGIRQRFLCFFGGHLSEGQRPGRSPDRCESPAGITVGF